MRNTGTPSRSAFRLIPALIVALSTTLAAFSVQAQTTVAGSIPGQFAVSPSGAATYRIPIQVPPGVAGMQPNLSLVYNSQSGNGLLGMGWNISGLSVIARCNKTKATDAEKVNVKFDASDRFCIDGNRLILVSGAYGAAGSEYRTEIETFSKITANGAAGSGPASFSVQTKDGLTLEYGNTADSRIEAVVAGNSAGFWTSGTVRYWAQNKITDVKGNHMTVAYDKDATNGAYYPLRIDYTGNAGTTPTLATTNSVQFELGATRTDGRTLYLAGSGMKMVKQIDRIKTYTNTTTLVKDYRFSYAAAQITGNLQLRTLVECDALSQCVPGKSFNWSGDTVAAVNPVQTVSGSDWQTLFETYVGDFNGDGIPDLYLFAPFQSYFCAGPGIASSNNCTAVTNGNWTTPKNVYSGDFNGDGISDLYLVFPESGYFCAGPGIASVNNCVRTVNWDWMSTYDVLTGDFNGDGFSDFYLAGRGSSVYCPRVDFSLPCTALYVESLKLVYDLYTGDFNGDDVSDTIMFGANGTNFCSGYINSLLKPNCSSISAQDWRSQYKVYTGDFNGDGLKDLFLLGTNGSLLCTDLERSKTCTQVTTQDWRTPYNVTTGDFDGDGLTDMLLVGTSGTFVCPGTRLAAGNAKLSDCLQLTSADWKSPYRLYVGDFNWDGLDDIYLVGSSASYFVSSPFATNPNLLTSITATNQQSISIAYGRYPWVNTQAPKVKLPAPIYVVSKATYSDGVGGNNVTNYSFGGLTQDIVTGRGMLGFKWFKSQEVTTGIEVYTEYNQDFPYIGIPTLSETRAAGKGNAGVLKRSTNTDIQCKIPESGTTCTVAPGNRYFPFVAATTEQSWDLNGAAFPSITTNTTYGLNPDGKFYGDVVQVKVSTDDGSSKTTDNVYFPADSANWILGRLKQATVTSVKP